MALQELPEYRCPSSRKRRNDIIDGCWLTVKGFYGMMGFCHQLIASMKVRHRYFVRLLLGFGASTFLMFGGWWLMPYIFHDDFVDEFVAVYPGVAFLITYWSLGSSSILERGAVAVMFVMLSWMCGMALIFFLGIPNHPLIITPF